MRTVYIDAGFICHAQNAEGRVAVEAAELDNVAPAALEFYRLVPEGMVYTKPKGAKIPGRFIQCTDSFSAAVIQGLYEVQQAETEKLRAQLEDAGAALEKLKKLVPLYAADAELC